MHCGLQTCGKGYRKFRSKSLLTHYSHSHNARARTPAASKQKVKERHRFADLLPTWVWQVSPTCVTAEWVARGLALICTKKKTDITA